ncbi:Gamma-aminobutyric acid type B receptor subunit 2 [Aphelenchoides fujianensis]|nr:Gamma-aminobutyric acid type B receptor subunit 2 [Aphelenchoides fujianensis]
MRSPILLFLIAWSIGGDRSSEDCYEYPHRQHKLTLGVLVPENFQHSIGSSVELALKHVHATPNLIRDYCIDLLYRDTQCKTSLGMKSLFDLMNAERRPVALFGSMCTTVNEPIAMAAKYWNILQMSYAETHAKFSTADSNEVYPTFYRIVPGDRNLISARCHLIRHYNWTRVGTIKQSDKPRYALPHESLTTQLENPYGIRVVYTAGVSSDQLKHIGYQLDELKRRDAHIIVGDLAPDLAIHVLCEAYRKEMFGADFVWILPGYHEARWWMDLNESNCTLEEIEQVLQNHLAAEFSPFRPDLSHSLISNHTVLDIKRHMEGGYCTQDGCETNVYGSYAYDGIWSLALALNASLYAEDGPNGEEENAEKTAARLLTFMGQSVFDGVTGTVRFEHNERLGLVSLFQWRNGSYTNIGYYDSALHVFVVDSSSDWIPPRDATVVVRQRQYVSYFLLGAMCSIALVGVILALMFLFINIKYRNHKFIKMSSPNLNNFIIVGSICAYISIFLLGLDTRFVSPKAFERLCYTKTWVLSVGFTLAFGSMFSKTWRVHSIFTNIRKDKKAIKDAQLFLIVALILLIDGVILGVWAFVSPFRFQVTEHEAIRHKNQLIIPELEKCQSHYLIFFQVIFYIIKGMLMIFGCFLAWETRAVNVPALNDSKYIGMSVYNVVVMSVIGVSLAFILQEKINEAFLLTSFFIIFCTTLTLCLVFVPKVVELFRTPRGTDSQRYRKGMMKSMVGKNSGEKLHRQLSLRISEGIKEKITSIEEENLKLHQILITRSAELWDLLERLRMLGEDSGKIGKSSGHKASNLCCVSVPGNEATSSSHYEAATTNDPQSSTSSSCRTDTFSSLFHRPSAGKSIMVRQKAEAGWPWLDPSAKSTML